jgi:Sulfotransferase domain
MTTTAVGTLPSFLVIGAMRSGSTTLHQALSEHPEIFMSQPKELHFFVAGRNWYRGANWYAGNFAKGQRAHARGESSATYSQYPQFPGVPERAASLLPRAKIVYLVREPVARMRSQFEHDVRRALAGNPVPCWSNISRHGSAEMALLKQSKYLDASSYAMQLDRWLEHYLPDDICVLTSEWLWADPQAALRMVAGFLGVDETWEPPAQLERLNAATRLRRHQRFGNSGLRHSVASRLPESVKQRLVRRVSPPPDLDSILTISADLQALLR